MKIMVTHAEPLVRVGLMTALRQHTDFEIHADGADATSLDESQVDVIIADYHRALLLVDAASRMLCGRVRSARVLVLTSNDREAEIWRAIEAGVHGYLLLGDPIEELIDGVTAVASGLRYMGRAVAQRMADLTRASLTSREIDVLRLVAIDDSNKAIARQLRIELGTVKTHMSAIFAKLGATSRSHAASIATTRGLVEEHAH
jgi:two-component system NarL family response regulator